MSLIEHVWVPRAEPAALARSRDTGWWGMLLLIVNEAMLFAGLISSYFFLQATADEWPIGGLPEPKVPRVAAFTVVLLASSLTAWKAERAVRRGDLGRVRLHLALTSTLAAAFVANSLWDFAHAEFPIDANAYASVFHTTVGLHLLHLVAGLVLCLGVQAKVWTGRITAERHQTLRLWSLYWHFVDAIWIVVFTALFLSPQWS